MGSLKSSIPLDTQQQTTTGYLHKRQKIQNRSCHRFWSSLQFLISKRKDTKRLPRPGTVIAQTRTLVAPCNNAAPWSDRLCSIFFFPKWVLHILGWQHVGLAMAHLLLLKKLRRHDLPLSDWLTVCLSVCLTTPQLNFKTDQSDHQQNFVTSASCPSPQSPAPECSTRFRETDISADMGPFTPIIFSSKKTILHKMHHITRQKKKHIPENHTLRIPFWTRIVTLKPMQTRRPSPDPARTKFSRFLTASESPPTIH